MTILLPVFNFCKIFFASNRTLKHLRQFSYHAVDDVLHVTGFPLAQLHGKPFVWTLSFFFSAQSYVRLCRNVFHLVKWGLQDTGFQTYQGHGASSSLLPSSTGCAILDHTSVKTVVPKSCEFLWNPRWRHPNLVSSHKIHDGRVRKRQ